MNEQIAKLYDRAIVLEDNGDYVSGELDPVKFAELIVAECAGFLRDELDDHFAAEQLEEHFGVK